MITKEELTEYSKVTSLQNLGQAEKDYFQNIILFVLYQNYGKDIVFKGGTALKKAYGLDRFSEDLDFTCSKHIDNKKLEDGMKRFKIEFETEKEEHENGLKITFRIRGPLYVGIRQSLCKFIVDFSFREKVELRPEIKTIGRFLEEIPSFDVVVMQEKEILAEKVRAIYTRTKARDVYDLRFLLVKGIEFDENLTEKKLKYYNKTWNFKKFSEKIDLKKSIWTTELKPLIKNVPEFESVKKYIIENIGKKKQSL